jgi:N6-adenosine-specific RNA methylase IME4
MQPHPLADLLPAMSAEEYADLLASIRANGVREPLMLHRDGRILDGRHRERACVELGITAQARMFEGTDAEALEYVLDLNLKRRHLNESQRAMLAADVATMRRGWNAPCGALLSQPAAAKQMNASRRSVQRAVVVRDRAIPEIVTAVRQGRIDVAKAEQVARLPEARQHAVAASLGDGRNVSTIVGAAMRSERAAVIERQSLACPLSALGRRFPVILADPPWAFELWSEGGMLKAADMHYPTMPTVEIAALPVAEIAARDAVLFLWAVPAMWPEALAVVAAWGFTYKTEVVRVKRNIACGHWFRGQHDPLIVASRGNMPPPPDLHSSVFFDDMPPSRHSAKPDCVRDWIASVYPECGKIELFARTAAPGWSVWGHEAPAEAAD